MLRVLEVLKDMKTNEGYSLMEISNQKNVLLVFLRHFGCSFCREAMQEISILDKDLDHESTAIILVHMSSEEIAVNYFRRYKIEHLLRISDLDCTYYKHFGLIKGTFNQLFGFRSWVRGIEASLIKGHGWGHQLGDGFQMPGVFFISKGKILSEFKHKYASDKPDYLSMMNLKQPQ
ncbi:MAG: redoxin domain-containing protein [Saprospiraceae bacterium]|mgnify:CR=1 FL=1|jgi:peroxiredoxin|nr:redoxin domain-containing protein [Candidatus Defluviibacterium haderslevense]MBK7245543.1 redoxin domain-containing protein [Candidatus Defluviibacterium haderslevense]MBK8244289.1 redoxin domain-containing protein [Candidatus Defluviibacterium haderslevense]